MLIAQSIEYFITVEISEDVDPAFRYAASSIEFLCARPIQLNVFSD